MKMDWWIWAPLLLCLLLLPRRQRRTAAAAHLKRRKGEDLAMKSLAKQFIGKECIVYTLTDTSGTVQGVVRSVEGGGMLVEDRQGQSQAVNLEYVTRIREFPRNKKGKKKPAVLD